MGDVIDSRFALSINSSNIIHYSISAVIYFIYRSGHASVHRRSTASRSRVYTQRQAGSNYCALARCQVGNALRISDSCILNLRSNARFDTIIGNCSSQGAAKLAAIASALFLQRSRTTVGTNHALVRSTDADSILFISSLYLYAFKQRRGIALNKVDRTAACTAKLCGELKAFAARTGSADAASLVRTGGCPGNAHARNSTGGFCVDCQLVSSYAALQLSSFRTQVRIQALSLCTSIILTSQLFINKLTQIAYFITLIILRIAIIIGNRSNVVHLIINDANGRTHSRAAGRCSIENNVADSRIVIRSQRHLGRTDRSLIVHADDAVRLTFHISKHTGNALISSLAAAKGDCRMLQIVLRFQAYIVTAKPCALAYNDQTVYICVMHTHAAANRCRATAGIANGRDKVFSFAVQRNVMLFSSCRDVELALRNLIISVSYACLNVCTLAHDNLRIIFNAVNVNRASQGKLCLFLTGGGAQNTATCGRSSSVEIGIVRYFGKGQ